MGLSDVDLLVVGGGVIGLSCAVHVAAVRPSWRIAIVDRPANAGVASQAAAGMLAPFCEFGADTPLFRLAVDAFEGYADFVARHAPGVAVRRIGTLLPAETAAPDRLGARATFLGSVGRPCRVVAGAELRALEPAIAADVTQALWVEEAHVCPPDLAAGLAASARAVGVQFIDDSVVAFETGSGGVVATVLASLGRVPCRRILVATGAWSAALGGMLGIALEMRPIKGQIASLAAPAGGLLRTMIHASDVYVLERDGDGVICGATVEDAGFDASAPEPVAEALRRAASRYVPEVATLRPTRTWIGFRPRTIDGLPVIGWSSRLENLLLATGHYRNGILLAGATGRIIADALAPHPIDPPSAFSPSRLGA